jgi:hypothetical protein
VHGYQKNKTVQIFLNLPLNNGVLGSHCKYLSKFENNKYILFVHHLYHFVIYYLIVVVITKQCVLELRVDELTELLLFVHFSNMIFYSIEGQQSTTVNSQQATANKQITASQ